MRASPKPSNSDSPAIELESNRDLQATKVCNIVALAMRNSDGTPGEVLLKYSKPGEVGNLGFGNLKYFGNWTLDMSEQKLPHQRIEERAAFRWSR